MTNHQPLDHPENCDCPYCVYGIFVCRVCGGSEDSLTTDCCGYKLDETALHMVVMARTDCVDGKWVRPQ